MRIVKDGKITLQRAIKCYKPCRLETTDSRYAASQRFKSKYGFNFEEIWSLDCEFAYFILVRLVYYREVSTGMPGSFLTGVDKYGTPKENKGDFQRWQTVLDKMIRGFFLYLTISFPDKKQQKIINKGMQLFQKHWMQLWD